MLYMVSYDLEKSNQNYPLLWQELEALGAERVLRSQWILRANNTTEQDLLRRLSRHLDADDRILVTPIYIHRVAWQNLMADIYGL